MDGPKRLMIQYCSLTFHESKNFLLTEAVCCGVYVWLFLRSIMFGCWMTCTKSITESARWSRWRGVIFGGQDWMLLLLRGFSNVMFVLPWASALQGHHYTLGNGLLSHGSISTLISLRRASWISWLSFMPIPRGWRWFPWVPWPAWKPLRFCAWCLHATEYRKRWFRTTGRS